MVKVIPQVSGLIAAIAPLTGAVWTLSGCVPLTVAERGTLREPTPAVSVQEPAADLSTSGTTSSESGSGRRAPSHSAPEGELDLSIAVPEAGAGDSDLSGSGDTSGETEAARPVDARRYGDLDLSKLLGGSRDRALPVSRGEDVVYLEPENGPEPLIDFPPEATSPGGGPPEPGFQDAGLEPRAPRGTYRPTWTVGRDPDVIPVTGPV